METNLVSDNGHHYHKHIDYKYDHNHHSIKPCFTPIQWKYVKYSIMLTITFSIFIVEVVVNSITESTTLRADSFHVISDCVCQFVGIYAYSISLKGESSEATFGYKRVLTISGFGGSIFLMGLCFTIVIEALQKLATGYVNPSIKDNFLLLIYVFIGTIVGNIFLLGIFGHNHGHSNDHVNSNHSNNNDIEQNHNNSKRQKRDANEESMVQHIFADILGSIIVMISAILIKTIDSNYAYLSDPILFILSVFIMLRGA
jgi:zinc transporter 1